MATLELTLHHPLPQCRRRLIHVSNQRKGVRPPLQRPGVLAIVTYVSKGRVPMRSTGSVEQPIELFSGLTYSSICPINLSLVATLELTLHVKKENNQRKLKFNFGFQLDDLFFFWENSCKLVSLVLGLFLEHSCPWPREGLYSKSLFLALASAFFGFLALALNVGSSTAPL